MSLELFQLAGRTALVTGSSRGLGYAVAVGLAEAGARIVLNGSNEERLAKAAAGLRERGLDPLTACFDVCDERAIVGAFERFDADGIEIDILINNAGIALRKPIVELSTSDWHKVIDTNLTSAFIASREAARRMLPRKRGKIVNIGSLLSELGRATVAPYAASKGGLKMLTRVMAAEWAEHGVQVNAIAPGYMLTEMNEPLRANPQFDAWVIGRTPARRLGKPEELVGAALFLASDASNYVSGHLLFVDGGMSAVL